METYATTLLYAIPFFVLLLGLEMVYGYLKNDQKYKVLDTVSSISSGLTNILKDVLGLSILIISYPFLLDHLALFSFDSSLIVWLIAFVAIDFAGYWNHRLSHRINFFWNQHIIHHSSEEFNLACALRQSISNVLGYFPIFLIPAAIFGVPTSVIAVIAPIHLFAQFWYHTQHIGKMGWLEYIIITPSQHRVHHAINPEYIDKNLGQILCLWDRLFGTFQEELEEIPPQYGVLKPVRTWNPILINFQHLGNLIRDAWNTDNYWDKLRIWFMPTGWRPADVVDKYPILIIEDVYSFERYGSEVTNFFKSYVVYQLLATLALTLFSFYNYSLIGYDGLLLTGLFIFWTIYGYSSLMDQNKYAVWIEIGRCLFGFGLVYYTDNIFYNGSEFGVVTYMITFYLISTFFGAVYFTFMEQQEINKPLVNE
ncbi:sterol desaturase family protein [Eudoraea chungangensis]|uniref:sterol desaturase family protein n=1 Tax=Eudoraea chungangensis TaxID=1481905 RepID=UPI0023EDADDD|nr:sterol desaturase family protein [Eudoraea chungangensis]